LFHVLPFQRRGLFRRIWLLLLLKPPRLKKIRTEVMLKDRRKIPAQQRHLHLCFLRILVLTGRGSVSKSLLLRVPPFKELQQARPLFEKMI
jgi:hypothetical protein